MGDGSVRLVPSAASAAAKLSTLMVLDIALAASPALAQSAMTPGGGATVPQPRVAPAPQAPVAAPQAPVVAPQLPLVAPAPSGDRVIQTTNSIRTTFVNGKLASRTEFPVGSSVGTFAVSSAKDTVILKFETNLGSNPVNGVGGTGGGRFQTNLGASPTNGVGGTGGGR